MREESIGGSGTAGAGSTGATGGADPAGGRGATSGVGHAGGLRETDEPEFAALDTAGYASDAVVQVEYEAGGRASRLLDLEYPDPAGRAGWDRRSEEWMDAAELEWREKTSWLDDFLSAHPFAAIGLGVAAGLVLGLGGDERRRARIKRRLRRRTAMAVTAGAALALHRLLRPPPRPLIEEAPGPRLEPKGSYQELDSETEYASRYATEFVPGYETEFVSEYETEFVPGDETEYAAEYETDGDVGPGADFEPDESLEWLVSAEAAWAFPGLPAVAAAEQVAGLWERIALEALPPRELCRAGDCVTRLTLSHPVVLAPDMLRLFGVWPELANTDATVGAQVAWTAGRGGAQRVVSALDFALQQPGVARTIAEAFVEAALGYASGASKPPLSHGVPSPPSTLYPLWPRDGRRGGGPPPPPPDGAGPERRDVPGPVHLGVAAPHAVRPRNRFLAYFAAYTASYADWVRESLMKEVPSEALRLDKKAATWKDGTRMVVVPVCEALEFDPPEAEFTWNGRFEILEFACRVLDQAPLGTTVLEFQVGARVADGPPVQFEKVRVSLGILEDAPVSTPRLVSRQMATSAFISYATPDRELVSYKLSPLRAFGVKVYDWRLEAVEGEVITDTIERAIREHELFFLFWSRNAQVSAWVGWEIKVALDAEQSGRPRIIPQLLENLDDMKDLPAALDGRQFFGPHFFLDRPEHIRELVARLGEPVLSPAGLADDGGGGGTGSPL